jgi:hypothetical protein
VSEDYFDVVFLNEDTAILYGRTAEGTNFYRELTEARATRSALWRGAYATERDALLRDFAEESA